MALWRTVLVDSEMHVADDLLEPWCGDTRTLDLECGDVAEIAVRVETSQWSDVLESYFAERHIEALV